MKKSELRRLIEEYRTLKTKSLKKQDPKIVGRLVQIGHQYYHETGNYLKSALNNCQSNDNHTNFQKPR